MYLVAMMERKESTPFMPSRFKKSDGVQCYLLPHLLRHLLPEIAMLPFVLVIPSMYTVASMVGLESLTCSPLTLAP
jgi:hypothetical protein